jgi:hypothetical protein
MFFERASGLEGYGLPRRSELEPVRNYLGMNAAAEGSDPNLNTLFALFAQLF